MVISFLRVDTVIKNVIYASQLYVIIPKWVKPKSASDLMRINQ